MSITDGDNFKGRCSLCLTFDGKDRVINRSQLPIMYLHAKFEQNRSIDGQDMAYLVFQGCSALKPGLVKLLPNEKEGRTVAWLQ